MKQSPVISAATAAAVLQHHFGKKPRRLKPAAGGAANYVFEAEVGRERLIVRISGKPFKLQVFMKEQWAMARAREHGVPTAEVLEVGNDVIGLPYMIARKVAGAPATALRDHRELLRELGRYAAIINAIPTHDFGPIFDWSPNKLSRRPTWREYLDRELRVEERCRLLRRARVLSAPALAHLRGELRRMRRWRPRPTLSHGDLRLKNVVVDDKARIVAILDWEKSTSNAAPFWELSLALHDLTIDEKEMFLHGYGLEPRAYVKLAPAIKALNLLNYAKTVRKAVARKNRALLESLRARLSGALDLHSV